MSRVQVWECPLCECKTYVYEDDNRDDTLVCWDCACDMTYTHTECDK